MKGEVDYLPESTGAIIKKGPLRFVPSSKVSPHDIHGVMPNTNISKTRSRVRLAVWISLLSMIFAIGFFVMGVFWLWHIEDREEDQEIFLNSIKKDLEEQQLKLDEIQKSLVHERSGPFSDPCFLPKEIGPCESFDSRWYFNADSGICTEFLFGGCDGNTNNFKTKHACEKMCIGDTTKEIDVCNLPSDTGRCRALELKYFFDSEIGECRQFNYGGCGGNENKFNDLKECQERCPTPTSPKPKSKDEICSLKKDAGPCTDSILRWHFDKTSSKCLEFSWGGCNGNENNFENEADCKKKCNDESDSGKPELSRDEICSLPSDVGKCRAMIPRYYYNVESEKCEEFVYGGCNGNKNNFNTEELCQEFCIAKPEN